MLELKTSRKQINFYKTKEPYGEFSNFARYPVLIDGLIWPTTEHYYQAQKFAGTEHVEAVRQSALPKMAAAIGRDKTLPLRMDWEEVKENVMRVALYAKFTQYEDLRNILLDTEDAILAEHTDNDMYWGDGLGMGKNRLGVLLMEVRESLRGKL